MDEATNVGVETALNAIKGALEIDNMIDMPDKEYAIVAMGILIGIFSFFKTKKGAPSIILIVLSLCYFLYLKIGPILLNYWPIIAIAGIGITIFIIILINKRNDDIF